MAMLDPSPHHSIPLPATPWDVTEHRRQPSMGSPLPRKRSEPRALPDLRQLQVFLTVIEERNFTAAAHRLGVTQSAVSHSMKSLEDSLESALFQRTGKNRVILTEAGEVLRAHACAALAELRSASRELDRGKGLQQTQLRIGAPSCLFPTLLPAALLDFHELLPHCERIVESGNFATLLERLDAHELDLIFGLKPPDAPPHPYRPLFRHRLTFVVSPGHPWALQPPIDPLEMAQTIFIVQADVPESHRFVGERLAQLGISQHRPFISADTAAVREIATIGHAVGILPTGLAGPQEDRRRVIPVPIPGDPWEHKWGLFYTAGRELSAVEESFARLAERHGSRLSEAPPLAGFDPIIDAFAGSRSAHR